MGKIVVKAIGIFVALLFVLLLVGIGHMNELHTFRAFVSGKVTDANGNAIAGAKVEYCLPNAPGDTLRYDLSTQTDSEGRYSMKLPTFTVALDTSPDYLRQVRITVDGYVLFGTCRELRKGDNPDCDYVLETIGPAAELPR